MSPTSLAHAPCAEPSTLEPGTAKRAPEPPVTPDPQGRYRQQMIRHRRGRSVSLGPCMRLLFEDAATIGYQVREMLRAERCGDPGAYVEEMRCFAHLLPDGGNWKATLQIEIPDADVRRRDLPVLHEAVWRVYVGVPPHQRVYAQVNEDLDDRHRARPSGVHFLRFELSPGQRAVLLAGAPALVGCADPRYDCQRVIPPRTLARLRGDLLLRPARS